MVLHGLKIWAVAVTVCVCVTNVASVPSNSSLVEDGLYPQMFNESVTLNGLRAEPHDNKYGGYTDGLVARIMTWENTKVRIFGHGIVQSTTVKLTLTPAARGTDCAEFPTGESLHVEVCGDDEVECAMIHVLLQEIGTYHFCLKHPTQNTWIHQGNQNYVLLAAEPKHSIPLWVQIILIIILQCLSGLFSGLNLGLLSLDPTELAIVASVGASQEKTYAKNIIPLRRKGNFLLCSLVIGNVLVNSTLTIFLDDLTSGILAVVLSTIGIVLFGEIVPQALCNRYGLAIGSATRFITIIVMAITCVISYPLSRLLDFLLGREIGTVYDRERLVELIRVTKDHNLLENDEVNIISGTLSLKRKTVGEIMTPLEDVFVLPYDAVLDFETLAEITREGYTRIPVYENAKDNVVGLLNIKDMALLDPDDCTAVKTLCKYYSYDLCFVFEDTTLDVMLDEFKKGRSHMAFIQKVSQQDDRDPVYETIGLVTLEDIIEEMIQAEILDESDKDSRAKKLQKKDYAIFKSRPQYTSLVTPQLQHASFQFLSTSLDAFKENLISEHILHRLIRHPEVARMIRRRPNDVEPTYIFQAGRPTDFFILILEGRVEVKIGFEGLVFESGPFTYFGATALAITQEEVVQLEKAPFPAMPSGRSGLGQTKLYLERTNLTGVFVPDFTVYAMSDVLFLRIKRSHYIAALRATALERQQNLKPSTTPVSDIDTFGQEMERAAKEDMSLTDFVPAIALTTPTIPNENANGSAVFIKVSSSDDMKNLHDGSENNLHSTTEHHHREREPLLSPGGVGAVRPLFGGRRESSSSPMRERPKSPRNQEPNTD